MRVRLYVKKIQGRGHKFLQSVLLPDGVDVYEVAVKQPLVVATKEEALLPQHTPVRVFRRQYSPLEEAMGVLPRFLEE
jgi:hypothetical protein